MQLFCHSKPAASKALRNAAFIWGLAAILFKSQTTVWAADSPQSVITTLEQLQNLITTNGQAVASFHLQGVVCAVPQANRELVLQDDSATVLLGLPFFDQQIKAGDNFVLDGTNCTLTRGAFSIRVGTEPVVDADGSHSTIRRSGKTFLDSGAMPLRVEWFNDYGPASLQIEYEGPGVKRIKIPGSALFHKVETQTLTAQPLLKPGLEYTTFVGNGWKKLPDFQRATKAGTGIVTGFDIKRRARPDQCAMVFSGFLQISNAGIYTFNVASDDGCRIFVGDSASRCRLSTSANAIRTVSVSDLSDIISEDGNQQWSQLEGKVNSVCMRSDLTELEISSGQRSLTAVILNPDGLGITNLIGTAVQVTGIYQRTWTGSEHWPGRLIVTGPEWVQIINGTNTTDDSETLTSISQIRALSPDQAKKHIPVRIRGIITMTTFWFSILQDASGGIYLPYIDGDWANQPRPGEVWKFRGVTDAGDFSPIVLPSDGLCLGYAALPQGIRPTWSDFQNGDLDAEQVDIEAAVIEVSKSEMTLLTRDGTVSLLGDNYRPLPRDPASGTTASLLGSVVRLRGVFTADWDSATRLVKPRIILLGNVSVSVIEAAPKNAFLGPVKQVRELLLFKSPTATWGLVKIAGVVLHSEPREYIVSDNTGSIRVYTRELQPIREGDKVEAVGFPQVGGPSPELLEGKMRKLGIAPLPKPLALTMSQLADLSHDAKLITTEALLLSDTKEQGERVLEMQAGQIHFLAKLRSETWNEATVRPGSELQLTGVYSSLRPRQTDNSLDAFELLLNRPDDIVVVRQPSWWTARHVFTIAIILAAGLLLSLAWVVLLRRTIARRSLQLKQEIENRQIVEHHRLLEQERSRVAQDLHDELGARLAEVGILGSLANNPDISREKQQGYLTRLAELGRLLVSGLDEIVWAVNPKQDSNKAVSGYLADYAQDFLNSANIACAIEVAQPLPDRVFTSHERHQLFLAFKESLTNVVKHAQATEVRVRIGGDDQSLWVMVVDNGKGLKQDHPAGDGLTNMSRRMKQIGGECEVKAQSGGGTIVTFHVYMKHESPKV